jgi:hypothetical protein
VTDLHVCFAHKEFQSIRPDDCPTCEARTITYGWFEKWYGWDITCLSCGERWFPDEGEIAERPFRPRWRNENIEAARKACQVLI